LGTVENKNKSVDINALQNQLEEYKRIIEEQERLLQLSLNTQAPPTPLRTGLNDSRLEEHTSDLEKQLQLLEAKNRSDQAKLRQLLPMTPAKTVNQKEIRKERRQWEKSPAPIPEYLSPKKDSHISTNPQEDFETVIDVSPLKQFKDNPRMKLKLFDDTTQNNNGKENSKEQSNAVLGCK